MLPRERIDSIKQIIIEEKKVYVSNLSKKFNVTEETIRRDLDKLEDQGIAIRNYGGAVLNIQELDKHKLLYSRLEDNIESIKEITKKAVDFIKESNTIIADCSLKTLEILKAIKYRKDVTVITNSLEVLYELNQSDLNIISTGGSVNSKAMSLQGNIIQDMIKKYNVDIALVDCQGMDINKGILGSNETEAEIKRTMIKQANKVILLVDNTKFNKTSFVKLFDYEDIDYIVTDKEPEEEWMNLFQSYNIKIIC